MSLQSSCNYAEEQRRSNRARYAYGVIFMVMNLKAWIFRDYGQLVMARLAFIKSCGVGGQECCRTLGVLRVSLGCFIFFSGMCVTTTGTRKFYQVRSCWHSGVWPLKIFLLALSMAVPFFIPSKYIEIYGVHNTSVILMPTFLKNQHILMYSSMPIVCIVNKVLFYVGSGELARLGAGVFLILQLVSVIEFIAWWNNYWMPEEGKNRYLPTACCGSIGLLMSTIFYISSVFGILLMYILYGRNLECSLNIFFITWTAVLLLVMLAISLHSKVNRGLLSSGIMASYIIFLCWSAIRSEPANAKCYNQTPPNGHTDWTTVLSFLIAICAIVTATFSTGIDSQTFQFRKDKVKEEDDITYDYGFFHMVFALGAMYFAMLFLSWNLKNSTRKWSIDVGWASTWVKIVNEWFAATIYLWKLISPVAREPQVMDHEAPQESSPEATLP